MNANEYLKNPSIPAGFYNVKCLDVETVKGLLKEIGIVVFYLYGR